MQNLSEQAVSIEQPAALFLRTERYTALFCISAALIVANLYYSQPLAGVITDALGLRREATGLIVTLTQIGFGLGLILLVPLGDIIAPRRLIPATVAVAAFALATMSVAHNPVLFLFAALVLGMSATSTQMLVPVAARLAEPQSRGRVIGNVMAGLLFGILAARPMAGLMAEGFGWRSVFFLSAGLMAALSIRLFLALPPLGGRPQGMKYLALLKSMVAILRSNDVLRAKAASHAPLFGSFTLFWTAIPMHLSSPELGLSPAQIAWFTLASAAGALAAPVTGRIADKGWSVPASYAAAAMVLMAFLMAYFFSHSVAMLLVAATLVDFGVQSNLILGQRAIYAASEHTASRTNGVFMALFFCGGALGSGVTGWLVGFGGWTAVAAAGGTLSTVVLLAMIFRFISAYLGRGG